jgi:dCTP deaminase
MSVQSDRWIRIMAREARMIEPFDPGGVRKGIVSFGLSSYGYDARLSDEFKMCMGEGSDPLDPKKFDWGAFSDLRADSCVVPPHGFVLGRTVEYFRIPRSILTIAYGKSTYARLGILVNVTPFEPEWEGYATLGISNTSPRPVRIYANEGIAQVVFLSAAEPCERSYRDKAGRYQEQREITPPRA